MQKYELGTVSAKPGTKAFGHVDVANRPDGTMLRMPVIVAHGVEDGPTVVVGACCHGDEHEGTMAVIKLGRSLDPKKLKGTFIGVPVINVPAFHNMRRGNPYDLYILDMNRIFPGSADGFITERIANAFYKEIVSRGDMLIDLHCGANILYLTELVYCEDDKSLELARAIGGTWDIIWRGKSFGSGTSLDACEKMGIPAVTLEVGGAGGRFDHFEECSGKMVHGVTNVMKHYKMLEGQPELPEKYMDLELVQIRCNHGGMVVPEPTFALRKWAQEGEKLMSIVDLFGEEVEEIRAPFDGIIVGRRVYPVIHAGEWVVFFGREFR